MRRWMAFGLAAALSVQDAAAETPVDLELVLAADASDSMDPGLGRLQRAGYAAALRDPAIAAAIGSGPLGRVAVAYVEWGDAGLVSVVAPWTLLTGPEEAFALAALLDQRRIARFTKTSISHALAFSIRLFDGNGFQGVRRVIDVSGNGPNNQGGPVTLARDAAAAAGVTVNGLPIMTDLSQPRGPFDDGFDRRDLDRYFEDCVIAGPDAFVLAVTSEAGFAEAIRLKLALEIAGLAPARALARSGPALAFAQRAAAPRMPCS